MDWFRAESRHFLNKVHKEAFEMLCKRVQDNDIITLDVVACNMSEASHQEVLRTKGVGLREYLVYCVDGGKLFGGPKSLYDELCRAYKKHALQVIQDQVHTLLHSSRDTSPEYIINMANEAYQSLSMELNAQDENFSTGGVLLQELVEYVTITKYDKGAPTTNTIYTGLEEVDALKDGLVSGELVVLAARPGMGKTALALSMILHNINQGKHVLLFSIEMEKAAIMRRLLTMCSNIEYKKLQSPKAMSTDEYRSILRNGAPNEATKQLYNNSPNLKIYDTGIKSVESIIAACRQQHRAQPVDFIVIDYLQLLDYGKWGAKGSGASNRNLEIGKITGLLKELAKELKIPVLLLSQLNRGVENRECKIPTLSDLRDSGSIEQDADVVMFIHREEYYLRMKEGSDYRLY
jgi:replicative DNA helicase